MSAFKFSPGHCGASPCGCGCTILLHFRGCSANDFPGVTVSAWESSSKVTLCGTGTTGAGGLLDLSVSPSLGSYYIEANEPSGRFATYSATVSCGGTRTVCDMNTPATGYTCNHPGPNTCPLPSPKTLYFSSPLLGAATLTYYPTGTPWRGAGSFVFTSPGAGYCPSGTYTFNISITATSMNISCVMSGTVSAMSGGGMSVVCSPWSLSGSLTPPTGVSCLLTSSTFTITE